MLGPLGSLYFPWPVFKPEVQCGGICGGEREREAALNMEVRGDEVMHLWLAGWLIGYVWLLTKLPCRKVLASL